MFNRIKRRFRREKPGPDPRSDGRDKQIVINLEPMETRLVVMEKNALQELFVERTVQAPIVGNVYKGKVSSVVPGIRAAFVDMGLGKNGFLYLTDIVSPSPELADSVQLEPAPGATSITREKRGETPRIQDLVRPGQELLVQVVKEPIGNKGPRLTTHLTLPGRFMVLMPMDNHFGLSKRIDAPKERDRLRKIFKDLRAPKDMGLIIRTAAIGASQRQLGRDLKFLMSQWRRIKGRSMRVRAPMRVHEEYDVVLRTLRDYLTDDVKKIVVDSKDVYKRIHRFLVQTEPQLRQRVEFYKGTTPLLEHWGVEREVERIFNRKVELPSGGYCVIEQTESLVAIDVNSGKFTGRRNLEETAFATNIEAANEIAKQIRLRDLGGILIIDFIDMISHSHRQRVFSTFQQALRKDRAKTNLISISEFGLVEMTRQRIRKNIESVSFQECPYCQGRGSVRSPITVTIKGLRQAKRFFQKERARRIEMVVHPEVAARLRKEDKGALMQVERQCRGRIQVVEEASQHLEEVKIRKV